MTSLPKIDNIDSEIRNIMNNNWNNIELINNINMIIQNYDNGKYVDKDIVEKFLNLKESPTGNATAFSAAPNTSVSPPSKVPST